MTETNEAPQGPENAANQGPAPENVVGSAPPTDKETNKDARMWGMFCHLAALAGIIVTGVGFVIGPLIVWLI